MGAAYKHSAEVGKNINIVLLLIVSMSGKKLIPADA